ncbi:triose-phosphate isomerase [Alcanivorax sp. 1008]|uniref:triose-phosphate isomerase n=1 Tax=Alcanivorax sp. 1008 TaxID=2816853 RepID=UPI001E08B14D|nr:triose-phosphate isomerase [Alcanivorax sp. 1008]MCC1497071.1 triose-phosphate isomerase [Alcanivorax sp. 1008]
MTRIPLVAGNWKMNGRRAMAAQLAAEVAAGAPAGVEVLLCPPLVYLDTVAAAAKGSPVCFAGQNVAATSDGAFTGEVSAEMLVDAGCQYVLVGHSERRTLFAEDNAQVADKFCRALEAGLRPVLCIGETLAEREAGRTEQVVNAQLEAVFSRITAAQLVGAVIAYEPVWAIGTGMTASPDQAQAVHAHIRARLSGAFGAELAESLRLLYGGSVKADNAASLFAGADIDGGLIGGASLDAETFLAICQAATA